MFGNDTKTGQQILETGPKNIRVPRCDIETFVLYGHMYLDHDLRVVREGRETKDYFYITLNSVIKHASLIDQKLHDIRICDPAVGSGAFPVGLLHEIVTCRSLINIHLEGYPVREDHEELSLYSERVATWLADRKRTAYYFKRHAIQECIYGVDIDSSAIDIARLRLWLSLIVDEEDFYELEPLPNLDYKFRRGNSLIGFPKDVPYNSDIELRLEELKKRFFSETSDIEKNKLRGEIESTINDLMNSVEQLAGYKIDFDFRLLFSEVWHEKNGFDIVVGNPPYVQIQKFSDQQIQRDWEKQGYCTFTKTGDIYCMFYEKGHSILREGGTLCFITSNKWMRAGYGQKMRRFLLDNTTILQLIDFGDWPIFSEATTYTNILFIAKAKQDINPKTWDLTNADRSTLSPYRLLDENKQGSPVFRVEAFVILTPDLAKIKQLVEDVGTPLKDWDISINYGIKTGFNEAFIIDGKKKDELISQDPKSAEIIKPILRGRDIKRYRIDYADLWLIVTLPSLNLDIDDYPAVHDYLKSFGKKLHQTGEIIGTDENGNPVKSRKKTVNKWYETQDQIAYHVEFKKAKIVYAEIVFDSAFYFDTSGIYPEATTFVLTGKSTAYLTALLNSELLTFSFRAFYAGGDLRGNTFRYKKVFLRNLPIVKADPLPRCQLKTLVDWVQCSKRANTKLQSKFLEQLIDGLVYELYLPDEIKAAGKDLLRHLGNLKPISDNMSDAEKLTVIQSEFDRLHDPNHPVRNHLETLDTVEEVRIIREALKK